MNRTRIKICGIKRREDARLAERAGADALGLVFYEPSPRAVSLDAAIKIAGEIGPLTTLVGLFVNPDASEVEAVLERVNLGLLQFHGDETAAFCASFGRPWIKAIRVRDRAQVAEQARQFSQATGLLLDACVPGIRGGSGTRFDWGEVPELPLPYLLAGGLDSDNVAEAVSRCRPYAVDVSSGVEAAPGIKDAAKMRAFIDAVGRADGSAREFS